MTQNIVAKVAVMGQAVAEVVFAANMVAVDPVEASLIRTKRISHFVYGKLTGASDFVTFSKTAALASRTRKRNFTPRALKNWRAMTHQRIPVQRHRHRKRLRLRVASGRMVPLKQPISAFNPPSCPIEVSDGPVTHIGMGSCDDGSGKRIYRLLWLGLRRSKG